MAGRNTLQRPLFLPLYLYLALKHAFERTRRLHPLEKVALARRRVSRKELHRKSGTVRGGGNMERGPAGGVGVII